MNPAGPMTPVNASPAPLPAWPYDDLVREGLSLIPAHAPEWTNHNASDPGITLVELLAYFTELLVYRLGRVTPEAKLQFLRLLEDPGWTGCQRFVDASDKVDRQAVEHALERTIDAMSRSQCLVTAADFERAAVEAARAVLGPDEPVRAVCLVGTALGRRLRGARRGDARAHVGVVVLPRVPLAPGPMARLCAEVQRDLSARCLLATTVHVFEPTVLHVAVGFRLTLRPGVHTQPVLDAVAERLGRHGGQQGAALRVTDITELIDATDGVDHVDGVALLALSTDADRLGDARSGIGVQIATHSTPGVDARLGLPPQLDPGRLRRDDGGRLAAIELQPWEVAFLHLARSAIEVIEPGAGALEGPG
jgi:hypothetical protein